MLGGLSIQALVDICQTSSSLLDVLYGRRGESYYVKSLCCYINSPTSVQQRTFQTVKEISRMLIWPHLSILLFFTFFIFIFFYFYFKDLFIVIEKEFISQENLRYILLWKLKLFLNPIFACT